MRRFWQGLAIVAAILVAAIATILIIAQTSWFNGKIVTFVKDKLGRDIEIKGRSSLRLRPAPTLRLQDVTLANPPQMAPGALLQAAAIEIDPTLTFSWWSWPSPGFSAVRIEAPKLQLSTDAQGRSNWQGLGAAGGASVNPVATSPGSNAGAKPAQSLKLGDISISNGTLTYSEAQAGERLKLDAVSLQLSQPGADAAIDATFDATLQQERIAGKARLASLDSIRSGAPTRVIVTLSAAPGRAEFDAMIEPGQAPKLSAKSRVDVPSLETLAGWLRLDPSSMGNGALTFAGDIAIQTPAAAVAGAAAPSPAGAWQFAIKNGALTLTGKADKQRLAVEKLEASSTFVSLSKPIGVDADLTLNGERLEAHATVQSPEALMNRTKSVVTARLASARGRIEINGDMHPGQDATFLGRAKGATASLRGLVTFAGFDLPTDEGLEAAEFDGEVAASAGKLRVWNAQLKVDDTTARGAVSVDASGGRPVIGGKLELDRLDAGRYLPRLAEPATKPNATGPGRSDAEDKPARSSVPDRNPFTMESVAETLRLEIGSSIGGARGAGASTEAPAADGEDWSEKPLPLAALKSADVDLDLSVADLKLGSRTMVVPLLKTVLKDGRLSLDGRDIASHGGKIKATLLIDAQAAVPAMQGKLTAQGVELEQFFTDLGINPYLAGKSDVNAELTARGNSQKTLVSSLSGSVKTSSERGALVGWDLRNSWRNIFRSFFKGEQPEPYDGRARTPIDKLTAEITIDKGVAEATVAQVNGPTFAVVGQGQARLLSRQADYRGTVSTFIEPRVEIPLRGKGPWSQAKPGLDPDAGGATKVILSYFGFGRSSGGASTESAGAPDDAEFVGLVRQYLDKIESKGAQSPDDAVAARKLRDLLGPTRR